MKILILMLLFSSENIRYKAEIEKWENKKDEQIETEFNQYNKKFEIKTEKGDLKKFLFMKW